MKNLKSIFFSTIAVSFLSLVFIIPAFASTSIFNLKMNKVYLDGRVDGAYHKLDAGKVLINGSTYVYSKDAGAKNTPTQLLFSLWNSTSGNSFGSVQAKVGSNFSGTFKTVGGGTKYYLIITRVDGKDDGNNIKGSGTLKN
ncbi:hypothetical protein [Gottfriedia acidiceleris]|uniref:hypothetical protein n=1 Tax=Gottfriedia acidiceleris TaxID=371036 RepID=UPI003D1E12E6